MRRGATLADILRFHRHQNLQSASCVERGRPKYLIHYEQRYSVRSSRYPLSLKSRTKNLPRVPQDATQSGAQMQDGNKPLSVIMEPHMAYLRSSDKKFLQRMATKKSAGSIQTFQSAKSTVPSTTSSLNLSSDRSGSKSPSMTVSNQGPGLQRDGTKSSYVTAPSITMSSVGDKQSMEIKAGDFTTAGIKTTKMTVPSITVRSIGDDSPSPASSSRQQTRWSWTNSEAPSTPRLNMERNRSSTGTLIPNYKPVGFGNDYQLDAIQEDGQCAMPSKAQEVLESGGHGYFAPRVPPKLKSYVPWTTKLFQRSN
jgi:hypothetical protein